MRRLLLLVCLLAGIATAQPATMASRPCRMDGADCSALPAQATHSGKYLTTNGTAASWGTVTGPESLPTQTGNTGKFLGTDGASASWVSEILWGSETIPGEWGPTTIPGPDDAFAYDYVEGFEVVGNKAYAAIYYGVQEYTRSGSTFTASRVWGLNVGTYPPFEGFVTNGAWNAVHFGTPAYTGANGTDVWIVDQSNRLRILDTVASTVSTFQLPSNSTALAHDGTSFFMAAGAYVYRLESDWSATSFAWSGGNEVKGLAYMGGYLWAAASYTAGNSTEIYRISSGGSATLFGTLNIVMAFENSLRTDGTRLYVTGTEGGEPRVLSFTPAGIATPDTLLMGTGSPRIAAFGTGVCASTASTLAPSWDLYFTSDATARTRFKVPEISLATGGAHFVGLRGTPSSPGADIFWTLPAADGTSGQVLSTDGAGALSWASLPAQGVTAVTTSPYTVLATDGTLSVNCTGGAVTVNLPAAASHAGRILHVKKVDSSGNAVTVEPNGAETIDGASNATVSTQWSTLSIQSDGTNWLIL